MRGQNKRSMRDSRTCYHCAITIKKGDRYGEKMALVDGPIPGHVWAPYRQTVEQVPLCVQCCRDGSRVVARYGLVPRSKQ